MEDSNISPEHIRIDMEREQRQLIETMIIRGLLATRETHHKSPGITNFDNKYHTNLNVDFSRLIHKECEDIIEQIVHFLTHYYLGNAPETYVVLHPGEFDIQPFMMGTFRRIVEKAKLREVRVKLHGVRVPRIKQNDKLIVLAPMYSEGLKNVLNTFSNSIQVVIILLAPNQQYLTKELIISPDKVRTLVSSDSLKNITPSVRHQMIHTH